MGSTRAGESGPGDSGPGLSGRWRHPADAGRRASLERGATRAGGSAISARLPGLRSIRSPALLHSSSEARGELTRCLGRTSISRLLVEVDGAARACFLLDDEESPSGVPFSSTAWEVPLHYFAPPPPPRPAYEGAPAT
jgi:hypothetical protein